MKCIVSRTSMRDKSQKPCEEAVEDDGYWTIEINSFEDLLKIEKKYASLVVGSHVKGVPHIEIYDDYRE